MTATYRKMTMTIQPMKFRDVIEAYRRLLDANPGKALVIGGGNVALLEGGVVIGAPITRDGLPDVNSCYDFDRNAYIEEEGRWDDETAEQLRASIETPAFVEAK